MCRSALCLKGGRNASGVVEKWRSIVTIAVDTTTGADVIRSRQSSLIATTSTIIVLAAACALLPDRAHAQWWTAAPADYEDCADRVEKSSLNGDAKEAALSNCESKFAGRRKRGGGYSYHDFMQNRTFDIAGPNPTAAEQKMIDEQYAIYLNNQRRSIILAAFAKKQNEAQHQAVVDTDFRDDAAAKAAVKTTPPVALPRPRPKQRVAKGPDCATEPLTCGWSKLSSGLKDIKDTLFGTPAPSKTKRI
jgi:hypothetical protein